MDQDKADIVEAAKQATIDGITVVPVREDGSKRPDLTAWAEYQTRKPTRDELRGWFGQYERTGLGWLTGAASGNLECIDFDDVAAFDEFVELASKLDADPVIRLLSSYRERTPKGLHLFYRCAAVEGNQKLARAEDGTVRIETRGEGGFVVVAPSYGGVHPSGEPYVAETFQAGAIADLTPDEREVVLGLARSLDRGIRLDPVPEQASGPAAADGTRPGDLFNGRATWAQVLEPAGWRHVHHRSGEDYWRRPHARTDGIDATSNYNGSDLLYVFSTSGAPFEPERGYSKFSAYALLQHAGDYQAAARDLAAQGYAEHVETDFGSELRLVANEQRTTNVRKVSAGRSDDYQFRHGWPDGHFVSRYIAYCSARTDAAHEYHEAAALALLAAVTPNVRTFLDPWPDGIATNLYFLLLGGTTSARKSTSLSFARRMLSQVCPSAILAERMTPEALVEQLAGRPRSGSMLVGDEFGEALSTILKSGSYMAAMRELILTLYSATRYKYVRRSKRDKSGEQHSDFDDVVSPHLTVLTASTGAIFETLSSRDVQTGLVPRFAIVYPTSQPPRRPIYERAGGDGFEEAWLVEYLQRLHLWSSQSTQSGHDIEASWSQEALYLADEASESVESSTDEITQRIGPMAVKIAMLSSLGDDVPAVQRLSVERRDAQQASRVAKRLAEAALRFQDEIGGLSADQRKTEQTIERVTRILRERGGTVTRSEAGRTLKMTARQLDEIEATMADRGIIRVMQQEPDGRGRPAKVWGLQ